MNRRWLGLWVGCAAPVKDSSMTIQKPTSTHKACTQPKGVMHQEREYLKALTTAATYTLQGNPLELRTAEDALAALFKSK